MNFKLRLNYDFNYKFNFVFPFLGLLLLMSLVVLIFDFLNIYFLNAHIYIVIVLFFLEAILSSYIKAKISLADFFIIIEICFFLSLIFYLLSTAEEVIKVAIFFIIITLAYLMIRSLSKQFFKFKVNYQEILAYDTWQEKWSRQDHRPGLYYGQAFKLLLKRIFLLDIVFIMVLVFLKELKQVTVIAALSFLCFQILIISLSYLEKKSLDWLLEGIKIKKKLKKSWFTALIFLFIVIFSIISLIPIEYSFKYESEGENIFFTEIDEQLQVEPSTRTNREVERFKKERAIVFQGINLFLNNNVIYIFLLCLIIAYLFYFFYKDKAKLKNTPYFFVAFFQLIFKLIKGFFNLFKKIKLNSNLRTWSQLRNKEKKKQEISKKEKTESIVPNTQELIVHIYSMMLKLLAEKTKAKKASQTPYEYSYQVCENLGEIEEVKIISSIYVKKVYSQHLIKSDSLIKLKDLWQSLQEKL